MATSASVAIVGYGAVGKGLQELFPDAVIYDEPKCLGRREEVNKCDFAFVSVPTPSDEFGFCDTTIVEEVIGWIEARLIVIRSTVEIGTTERLRAQTGKRIVFQPEYGPGETPDHPFRSLRDIRWIILGGERRDTIAVTDLYKHCFNADISIHQTTSQTAELCKYMENAYLAMKVAFCNEFYDLAQSWDVDYNELRELWVLDPRIGRSHTFVFPESRGFGGKCLPKDLSALVAVAESMLGRKPILLDAVRRSNEAVRAPKMIAVESEQAAG